MRSMTFFLAATATIVWLWGQSLDPTAHSETMTHVHPQPSSAEQWSSAMGLPRSLYEVAMRMHDDMLRSPPTGNADVDFLVQMIPHHEGAVEMARLYLGGMAAARGAPP